MTSANPPTPVDADEELRQLKLDDVIADLRPAEAPAAWPLAPTLSAKIAGDE